MEGSQVRFYRSGPICSPRGHMASSGDIFDSHGFQEGHQLLAREGAAQAPHGAQDDPFPTEALAPAPRLHI